MIRLLTQTTTPILASPSRHTDSVAPHFPAETRDNLCHPPLPPTPLPPTPRSQSSGVTLGMGHLRIQENSDSNGLPAVDTVPGVAGLRAPKCHEGQNARVPSRCNNAADPRGGE